MSDRLPAQVNLPPSDAWDLGYGREARAYVAATVKAAGIRLVEDAGLNRPPASWSAVEIAVDGEVIGLDYGDYAVPPPAAFHYPLWLRYTYTRLFEPMGSIGSFPITSFLDWDEYERMTLSGPHYHATGDRIMYGMRFDPHEPVLGKPARRGGARDILAAAYPHHADLDRVELRAFWRNALDSLCAVCMPGANGHNLDRGHWQLMGLGVCTVSPEIWTAPLEDRPIPGVHYVACRDDLTDLVERIEWVREHRAEAAAIGARAREFFRSHGTPKAIWRYVRRRLDEGRSPGISAQLAERYRECGVDRI